jgi:ubiquinone/menaquinone biosynthesis C-methylase UbiE
MVETKTHWENIYTLKEPNEVSWYREHLDNSLELILRTKPKKDAAIIDVGGDSTLVDDLLASGLTNPTVLDISAQALARSKSRLGSWSDKVTWIETDVTRAVLPENYYDIWHDRAVFHFLTEKEERKKYVELVKRSLKAGGHIVVASFGLNGPAKCSGLEVIRYSPETMQDEFGKSFRLVESLSETHLTPFGTTQEFTYCFCQKTEGDNDERK